MLTCPVFLNSFSRPINLIFLLAIDNFCHSFFSLVNLIQIPPPPPRPDFDASREKLQKLGEGEGTMTKEEFLKTKQELEAEYLATFKKTVAMHEVFLQRLAAHPKFKNDPNFRIFLGYTEDVSIFGTLWIASPKF